MNGVQLSRIPQLGEVVPWFVASCDDIPAFAFDSIGGRWVVLMFFGSLHIDSAQIALSEVIASRALFDDHHASFFGVTIDPDDRSQRGLARSLPGLRYFNDYDRAVSRLYGVALGPERYKPWVMLLDSTLRVVASEPLTATSAVLTALASNLRTFGDGSLGSAPVLIVPKIFEPEFCHRLIAHYWAVGGTPSGFMRQQGGKTIGVHDPRFKRRSDVVVDDEALKSELKMRLHYRLLPIIERSFGWRPNFMERYLIASYDESDQGFFQAHRDNTTAGTAHRRLAVTVNLNTDEYSGGELWFPEYGAKLFKPPTGGAAVFGCGLLHEARPVTEGRRYAYLPFLYDEEGAALRDRNLGAVDFGP